ncbi:MAG: hypothetical protein COA99_09350 [Moraxellaceae bacterium]|nr:MAG: hypothetical protein COA99_09350 [Moraxellaceae bacterium]
MPKSMFKLAKGDTYIQSSPQIPTINQRPWRVLIVDNNADIHTTTEFALSDFTYLGKPLEFVHDYSAEDARATLEQQIDIALVFIDIEMETNDTGLLLAKWIRDTLKNQHIRIVLRTVKIDFSLDEKVFSLYGIDDFRSSTELTRTRLVMTMYSSLRAYADIARLHENNISLNRTVTPNIGSYQSNQENEQLRVLTQELLLENKKLLSANSELKAFGSAVSHGLKNHIFRIGSLLDIIKYEYGSQFDEELESNVDYLVNETTHMTEVIDNLLRLSKMSKQKLNIEKGNLTECVEKNIEYQLAEYSPRNIILDIKPGIFAYYDKGLMDVMISNLVSNSLKFSSKNDTVKLGFTTHLQNGRPVYTISDNGVGFDMKHYRNLFTGLRRLHSEEDFPGRGIGLVTVSRIVKKHGGNIWAESKVNIGTSFHFTLPFPK